MKRIGILTSGGDCQGLNSTIRAVAKTLYQNYGNDGVQIIGIIDGYRGLIYNETRMMKPDDFSGILTRGGTILGTSRQPFKLMRVIDENSVDKVAEMKKNYKKLELDYGKMVALVNNKVVAVPLEEIAGKLKAVPADHEIVAAARKMGICFGDEK